MPYDCRFKTFLILTNGYNVEFICSIKQGALSNETVA